MKNKVETSDLGVLSDYILRNYKHRTIHSMAQKVQSVAKAKTVVHRKYIQVDKYYPFQTWIVWIEVGHTTLKDAIEFVHELANNRTSVMTR